MKIVSIVLIISLGSVIPQSRAENFIQGDVFQAARLAGDRLQNLENVRHIVTSLGPDIDKLLSLTRIGEVSRLLRTSLDQAADGVSEQCMNATEAVITGLFTRQTWALKMIDAAGKPPSSILRDFRFTWLGAYSECLEISADVVYSNINQTLFKGQYCNAAIPIPVPANISNPTLAAAGSIPLTIGLCMPDSCNNSETEALVRGGLETIHTLVPQLHLNVSTIHVSVDCKDPGRSLDTKAIVAIVILGVFVLLMSIATLFDVVSEYLDDQNKEVLGNKAERNQQNGSLNKTDGVASHDSLKVDEYKPLVANGVKGGTSTTKGYRTGVCSRIFLAFSVYTNGKKLLNTDQPSGSLSCVNGLRFLSMTWVILGHSTSFPAAQAYDMGDIQLIYKRWTFQAIVNATVSVDSFFVLSGLLVTYLALKEMKKNNGKLNWIVFYVHRYWRLTPAYMLVMMVYTCVVPYIGQGPLWNEQGDPNCEKWWWTNMLYINNFFSSSKQCMGWGWYLANDMQFYIISPLILLPLFKFKVIGLGIMFTLALGNMIIVGVISAVNHLGPGTMAIIGAQGQNPIFFTLVYVSPYGRVSAYVAGMLFGYLLYKTDCKVRMNKVFVLLCWLVAAFLALAIVYGLFDVWQGHGLAPHISALYNATFRFAWSMSVGWVIFACCTGYGGFVNTLLSWKALIPLSRLTYCTYLIHPALIQWYISSQETLLMLTDNNLIYMFFGHLVAGYSLAFVFSLMFEAPMMALEKVLRTKK